MIRLLLFILLVANLGLGLSGCREEESRVPEKALKQLNAGVFPTAGSMQFILDGSGYVNGNYMPIDKFTYKQEAVSYTGDWQVSRGVPANRESFCLAKTNVVGDRVDITATMTALIFNFITKPSYPEAGSVTFFVDDVNVGNLVFDEDSSDAYMVFTDKEEACKVSLVLNAGGVCISGYVMNVPSYSYPPPTININSR